MLTNEVRPRGNVGSQQYYGETKVLDSAERLFDWKITLPVLFN